MSKGWHIRTDAGSYTLARRLPVRFDVAAKTRLPKLRKDRLARQIRQDMWRLLQSVRAFAPAVRIIEDETGLDVTAGGSIDAKTYPRAQIEARIAGMLEDPRRRARWIRWAS